MFDPVVGSNLLQVRREPIAAQEDRLDSQTQSQGVADVEYVDLGFDQAVQGEIPTVAITAS